MKLVDVVDFCVCDIDVGIMGGDDLYSGGWNNLPEKYWNYEVDMIYPRSGTDILRIVVKEAF